MGNVCSKMWELRLYVDGQHQGISDANQQSNDSLVRVKRELDAFRLELDKRHVPGHEQALRQEGVWERQRPEHAHTAASNMFDSCRAHRSDQGQERKWERQAAPPPSPSPAPMPEAPMPQRPPNMFEAQRHEPNTISPPPQSAGCGFSSGPKGFGNGPAQEYSDPQRHEQKDPLTNWAQSTSHSHGQVQWNAFGTYHNPSTQHIFTLGLLQ